VAAVEATNQAIWLRRILKDMGEKQSNPTTINCDNKSTIAMIESCASQQNKTYSN